MKKSVCFLCLLLALTLLLVTGCSSTGNGNQGTGKVDSADADNTTLGDYTVEILSCRLAEDYEGKPVAIVKYSFTNNSDSAQSFMIAFDDAAFQNGVGLNEAYFLSESANYSSDNQMKEIKTGATIEVEAAYLLNDNTTDVEIEVSELFSLDDKVISKTFRIV